MLCTLFHNQYSSGAFHYKQLLNFLHQNILMQNIWHSMVNRISFPMDGRGCKFNRPKCFKGLSTGPRLRGNVICTCFVKHCQVHLWCSTGNHCLSLLTKMFLEAQSSNPRSRDYKNTSMLTAVKMQNVKKKRPKVDHL